MENARYITQDVTNDLKGNELWINWALTESSIPGMLEMDCISDAEWNAPPLAAFGTKYTMSLRFWTQSGLP
ncbi:hypothetical protein N7495_001914 [Penicillium taxi]|uniref:uncharacterized protein n=1 Tax=Penicillium taxi TaxID=168475 RepID=UPI0025455001|nr:uncharacterized protein N7495_001914 [Penicillium taxi]KAJ5909232.1 hypothetical protein N7495_001914 [Penicillium taxi]